MGFLRGHILAALACGLLSEGARNFGGGGVVCVGNLIADERIFAFSTMVINRGLVPLSIGAECAFLSAKGWRKVGVHIAGAACYSIIQVSYYCKC